MVRRFLHNRWRQRLAAFSLIEVSIVLMIVGVLIGAVFKGVDLLETAKIHAVANDLHSIKMAINAYQDTFHALPGDDSQASERFGADVTPGNGDAIIDQAESDLVFLHLYKSGEFSSQQSPVSKFGGHYRVVHQPQTTMEGHWLLLAQIDGATGVLTPKQAQKLLTKMEGHTSELNQGQVHITNDGNASHPCLSGSNALNIVNKQARCLVYIKI